jgi:hypothetical protein
LERLLYAIWVSIEHHFRRSRQRCLNIAAKRATLEEM